MKYLLEILKILLILFLQIFVFSNLHFLSLCYPYVYVLALITLPVVPRWGELLIGCSIGLVMDICCSTPGVNMASCVLVSYLRPIMLAHLVQDHERISGEINALSLGTAPFLKLSLLLCAIHHLVIFLLDAWSFADFHLTLLRWLVSTLISLVFILAYGFRKSL